MKSIAAVFAISASLVAVWTPELDAQVPFSQHATLTQRVSYTDIEITYNRPQARKRLLFGTDTAAVVKLGQLWHPGADSASRVKFDKDVTFEGKPLARGEYSIWLQTAVEGPWTVILNSASHVFHTPYPGTATDVLRVSVVPERGQHMDALAYYFPVVARDSTVLRIHWGETMIPIRIRVSRDP